MRYKGEVAVCLQTAAEGEAKQADIRAKHLKKQLAEQQKGLASKKREAEDLEGKLRTQQRQVEDCRQRCDLGLHPFHFRLPLAGRRLISRKSRNLS